MLREYTGNLGITIVSRLTMADHVSAICRACYFQLRQLRVVLQSLTSEAATSLVHAFISCRLDYCNALLYGIADCQLQRLQSVQNAAARLVTGFRRMEHISPILKSLHWLPIWQRVTYKLETLVNKCINGRALEYLAEFCHPGIDQRPGMRSADSGKLHVPRTQTSFGDRSFAITGPCTWNNLPDSIRDLSLSF